MAYLWAYYTELAMGRGEGLGGGKLTWQDLEAWSSGMDRRLQPHEKLALLELDEILRTKAKIEEGEPADE